MPSVLDSSGAWQSVEAWPVSARQALAQPASSGPVALKLVLDACEPEPRVVEGCHTEAELVAPPAAPGAPRRGGMGPPGPYLRRLLSGSGCATATHVAYEVLVDPDGPGGRPIATYATFSPVVDERPPVTGTGLVEPTEVTVERYQSCVRSGACTAVPHRPGCLRTASKAQYPQNCVTWAQAAAFCRHEGSALPDEAVWRGSLEGGGPYWWGDQWPPPPGQANLAGALARRDHPHWRVIPSFYDGFGGPSPVGWFSADRTSRGVVDLVGNVSEWTASRAQGGHVALGAGFGIGHPPRLRRDFRWVLTASTWSRHIGFRCLRRPNPR